MSSVTTHSLRFPWRLAILFAIALLLIGMLDGRITLSAVHGNPAKNPLYLTPLIWPADWFFGLIWSIIYPCLGVATALIWQHRHLRAIRAAMACFVALVVMTLLFLPLSIVVQGNPLGLLLMDICGLLLSLLLAWAYRRVTPLALWWLTPLLLWMPVTLLLKVWYLSLNLSTAH
jgi:tryptophan-rich sensory protein